MRPARYQQFAIDTYRAAGLAAEPWEEGTRRPYGVCVTLPSGARLWHAITAQARPGDDGSQPEEPVVKEAPNPLPLPEIETGRVPVPRLELYLSALINNAGSGEIESVYGYSDRSTPPTTPGFGVRFWSEARIYAPFVRSAAPGGRDGGAAFDLPAEI
ncbi:hypothetical protein [Streptomyces sedi]|uniref:Uncharacterized protein n=1 Tax=Streptomyces sedi TaxID=555059 RepID=A0A5C4UXN9_9ACTN|nr:hypothetical protein [Streptomyces sedi]TNM28431.1 hypothetical protein FH715_17900 [Streptomyces sedi]